MDAYSQERRLLQIDTVLGKDHVLLVSVQGEERISSLFSFDLELASTDHVIQPDDILGTAATILIRENTGAYATVNGIISRFGISGPRAHGFCVYRVSLVPSLWFLTRTSDCRIFQNKNVREIVDEILIDYNIKHKDWKLGSEHDKHEYCVQYRETAYDFICRLLEEEGIFFYFRHNTQNNTVVFCDNNHGLAKCADPNIPVSPHPNEPGSIWQWEKTYRFRSAQWALLTSISRPPPPT
jgi:type VI secretion system secreted protein VgrG